MLKAILSASTALVVVASGVVINPALAADPDPMTTATGAASNPFDGREQPLPPILRVLKASGVKITALTPVIGDLSGYLLEDQSGKMQVVYVVADGKSMVVGVQQVIATDGRNLQNATTMQFAALKNRFDDARRKIETDQRAAEDARAKADAAAEDARAKAAAAAAALTDQQRQISVAAKQYGSNVATPSQANAAPPAELPASPAPDSPTVSLASPAPLPQAAVAAPAEDANAFLSKIKLADFKTDTNNSSYFALGKLNTPVLYMVADPQCPHCHNAWSYLDPLVRSGAITVRVVLIAGLPGSDPLTVSILSRQNPGKAWLDGEGSTATTAVAPPPPETDPSARRARHYLDANMDFIRKVSAQAVDTTEVKDGKIYVQTPWMAYVKDGKVYQYSGDADVSKFVSGMPKTIAEQQ